MKKLKLFALVISLFVFCTTTFSQGKFAFNLQGSFPVSDYGSDNMDNEDSGGAGIGGGIGIQYVHPIMENGLGVFVGLDAIYNGYKNSFKDDMENMLESLVGTQLDIKWSKMLNFPISAGLNFTRVTGSGMGLFANLGLSYNFFKETDLVLEANGEKITGTSDLAGAFGVKVGGGLLLNDKTSLFINYLGLGKHDLNMTLKGGGESLDMDGEQKIDMITIGVGIRF
jgi:hypothetical protein